MYVVGLILVFVIGGGIATGWWISQTSPFSSPIANVELPSLAHYRHFEPPHAYNWVWISDCTLNFGFIRGVLAGYTHPKAIYLFIARHPTRKSSKSSTPWTPLHPRLSPFRSHLLNRCFPPWSNQCENQRTEQGQGHGNVKNAPQISSD